MASGAVHSVNIAASGDVSFSMSPAASEELLQTCREASAAAFAPTFGALHYRY